MIQIELTVDEKGTVFNFYFGPFKYDVTPLWARGLVTTEKFIPKNMCGTSFMDSSVQK